ncbi:MAG: hypothetical protein RLY64_1204 [Bacteroidota bacterium]|jgi:hypothetical protein
MDFNVLSLSDDTDFETFHCQPSIKEDESLWVL